MSETLTVKLPDFEGPLDLLVHLIEKDKVDIYDIPIVSITQQYIAYINEMQVYDLDMASEFLLIAAMLLQIKSRMLLPKDDAEEEEENDPRNMLVEMLVLYQKFKKRAGLLRECLMESRLFAVREPMKLDTGTRKIKSYTMADLLRTLINMIPAPDERPAVIPRQEFHVQDKMEEVLQLLRKRQNNNQKLTFTDFIHSRHNRSETIAAFLALLELLRLKQISIQQEGAFSPIYITERKETAYGDIETGTA